MDVKEEKPLVAETEDIILPPSAPSQDEDSGSETEDMEIEAREAIQNAAALEVRAWLDEHGVKLFALEISKKRVFLEKAAIKQGFKTEEKPLLKRKLPLVSETSESRPEKRRRAGTRFS